MVNNTHSEIRRNKHPFDTERRCPRVWWFDHLKSKTMKSPLYFIIHSLSHLQTVLSYSMNCEKKICVNVFSSTTKSLPLPGPTPTLVCVSSLRSSYIIHAPLRTILPSSLHASHPAKYLFLLQHKASTTPLFHFLFGLPLD